MRRRFFFQNVYRFLKNEQILVDLLRKDSNSTIRVSKKLSRPFLPSKKYRSRVFSLERCTGVSSSRIYMDFQKKDCNIMNMKLFLNMVLLEKFSVE
jgi:hypothetical protein